MPAAHPRWTTSILHSRPVRGENFCFQSHVQRRPFTLSRTCVTKFRIRLRHLGSCLLPGWILIHGGRGEVTNTKMDSHLRRHLLMPLYTCKVVKEALYKYVPRARLPFHCLHALHMTTTSGHSREQERLVSSDGGRMREERLTWLEFLSLRNCSYSNLIPLCECWQRGRFAQPTVCKNSPTTALFSMSFIQVLCPFMQLPLFCISTF